MCMIRAGVPSDLPAASEVLRRAALSNVDDRATLLAHPDHLVLEGAGLAEGRTIVAEVDGAVVGFATWADMDGVVELEDLFVDPAWTRRAIGSALVTRIVEDLRTRGVDRLHVTANPRAMDFYLAAGFVADGVINTAFGPATRMSMAVDFFGALDPQDAVELSGDRQTFKRNSDGPFCHGILMQKSPYLLG